MEQQLKHRLIGVIIVVALIVIFVPMLFEKSDDKGKLSSTGIPSIPDDILENTIELPKTAEDIAPPKEDEKKTVESGYKIVPFNNEDTPPKPKSAGQSKTKMEGKMDIPLTPEEEDTSKETKPGMEVEKEIQPVEAVKQTPAILPDAKESKPQVHRLVKAKHHKIERKAEPAASPATEPDVDLDPVEGEPRNPVKAENSTPKTHHSHASLHHKQGGSAIHKPVTMKNAETSNLPENHHHIKVKESKHMSSPLLPETERDLEVEPVPAPAKPATPHAKTKSSAGTLQKPKVYAPKKPNTVKPSEPRHTVKPARPSEPAQPVAKVGKTEHTRTDADAPQAKPKPAKTTPVPAKPIKPADSE